MDEKSSKPVVRATTRWVRTAGNHKVVLWVLGAVLVMSCGVGVVTAPHAPAAQRAQVLASSTSPTHNGTGSRRDRRPNVLMVMTDDMRVDELRFMPSVRAYLGRRGLQFQNSFSPYPLCCPARASFLSGQYSHNHEVFSHAKPYGFGAFDDSETLATALHRSGYNTGFVGKYLNGYGQMRSRVTGKESLRYVPAGWTDWHAGSDGTRRLRASSPYRGYTYNYFDTTFNVNGRLEAHDGEYQTTVLGRKVRGLIAAYHRSPAPFFLYMSTVAPHGGGPRELGDPVAVPTPEGGVRNFDQPARPTGVKGRFNDVISRSPGLPADGSSPEADNSDKPEYMRRLSELSTEEREALTNVARQRAESLWVVDLQFKKIVRKLKRTGEYKNTVIMFTSDNGYFLGEHRIRQGKVRPYEPALRVPFLVAGPGFGRGNRYDPIKTMDVTATIADLANTQFRYRTDGRSLLPTMKRGDRGWRTPVLTEALMRNLSSSPGESLAAGFDDARQAVGVRTARYKYIRYATGEAELYDLDRDPGELRNVVDQPAYARVQRKLHATWLTYKDCAGDGCRARMPKLLQAGPEALRRSTRLQQSRLR